MTDRRSDDTLPLYCGIDWATDHHDVAVVDGDGRVVVRGRVGNDAAGFAQLLTLLVEADDTVDNPIPVGDRNRPRAVRGRAARHRPGDLSDQPAGRLAVSVPACVVGGQIRCHRRGLVCQHCAHRSPHAPAAAGRHRAGPSHPGARPRPKGRGVGPPTDRQSGPRPAQRLLPGHHRRLCRPAQRADWPLQTAASPRTSPSRWGSPPGCRGR